jgi:hypothetical protein
MGAPDSSVAQDQRSGINELRQQGYSVGVVTPVYSQLVRFSFPSGFKPAHQNDTGSYYIQESVLEGETVQKWSQMITLTGSKGLSANPNATPQRFLQQVAAGYQRACPPTFSAKALGALTIDGRDAFAAIIGCGAVQSGPPRSEVAVLLAVKGSFDYYTIQWAERASPISQPPVLDDAMWLVRLKQLYPIKLCERVPNEPAPYPSCVDQK